MHLQQGLARKASIGELKCLVIKQAFTCVKIVLFCWTDLHVRDKSNKHKKLFGFVGCMIYLYNTLTRKKEKFVPLKVKAVGMYACGPTVYNYAHIGNLRTYIFVDLLRRMFRYNGFAVKHVMNITDVGHLTSDADEGEDKMEKGARREGKSVWEIADYYTKAFFDDFSKLNLIMPDETPRATQHIPQMIDLIKRLEANGHTYTAEGNVYYDVSTFPDYGKLAKLHLDELQEGARVEKDENKKNHYDFVLWFTKSKFKKHAMQWDSPWGKGYPGWHIECSAMSMHYLGEQFDIHTGGIDHISIHHTNEIAQSEGATGKQWVKYWVHGEFLVLDKEKMAKSGDTVITLKTLEDKGFHPLDYRYFCFGAHYRKQLTFTFEALESAKHARSGLYKKIIELRKQASQEAEEQEEERPERKEEHQKAFSKAIEDDLNIPEALAVLWNVIKDHGLSAQQKLDLVVDFDRVFGLDLDKVKEEKFDIPDEVLELIKQREAAREAKDFSTADELREAIMERGYSINDTAEGPDVKRLG